MSGLSLKELQEIEELVAVPSSKIVLEDLCFPEQLAFINDPSQFATAVTSRRAGKTTGCGLHLVKVGQESPGCTMFYITYARSDAKGIIWPILHEINREYNIGATLNESDLTFKLPNNSIIRLGGAATAEEINRYRGYSIKLSYVDEAQRFGSYLRHLVDDVLVPACFDTSGSIRLTGTPGPVPVGYFNEINKEGSTWSRHHWTMFQNPWVEKKGGKSPQKILEEELIRRNVDTSDPTIQREMFGRWVVDTKTLVIDYSFFNNHFDELPAGTYSHILSIDLGFDDADAIAIIGHTDNSPITYLVDELVTPKQGLTELFDQVERLRRKYEPYKIIVDTGGLGLKIAESMRPRYRVPVHAADKTRKFENIELLNDALRTGRFKARKDSRFAEDAAKLEWDVDKLKPDKKVISNRFHSDIIDAVLYGFRQSPAYAYSPPPVKAAPGSSDWAREQVTEMERLAEEHLRKEENSMESFWGN